MPDILTTVFGLNKQTIGGNRNTWGATLNSNFDKVEAGLAGVFTKVVVGGSYSLTDTERRNRIFVLTGTLAADQTLVLANLTGKWTVANFTSGAYALSFKTASGTAVAVPQGQFIDLWCDGADTMYAGAAAAGLSALTSIPIVIGGVSIGSFSSSGLAINAFTVGGVSPVPIGLQCPFSGIAAPGGWSFCYGQSVSRTTYANLFNAITIGGAATRNATTTLTVADDYRGKGLIGAPISGVGIQSGTTVTAIAASSLTLSLAATGSGATTIRICPYGVGDGTNTFDLPDKRGRTSIGNDAMGGTAAGRVSSTYFGASASLLGGSGGQDSVTISVAQSAVLTYSSAVTGGTHHHTTSLKFLNLNFVGAAGTGRIFLFHTSNTDGDTELFPTTDVNAGVSVATTANAGGGAHTNVQPSQIDNWIIFHGVA